VDGAAEEGQDLPDFQMPLVPGRAIEVPHERIFQRPRWVEVPETWAQEDQGVVMPA